MWFGFQLVHIYFHTAQHVLNSLNSSSSYRGNCSSLFLPPQTTSSSKHVFVLSVRPSSFIIMYFFSFKCSFLWKLYCPREVLTSSCDIFGLAMLPLQMFVFSLALIPPLTASHFLRLYYTHIFFRLSSHTKSCPVSLLQTFGSLEGSVVRSFLGTRFHFLYWYHNSRFH